MNVDTNVKSYVELPSPESVAGSIPSVDVEDHVHDSRQAIMDIIDGKDNRKILIIGPCMAI